MVEFYIGQNRYCLRDIINLMHANVFSINELPKRSVIG